MKFLLFLSMRPQLLMYNLLYGFKVINHFKAKFYLMAEMKNQALMK